MEDLEKTDPYLTDDRAPVARAMARAWEIIAICAQTLVPPLLGLWIDRLIGSLALFCVLGGAVGLWTGASSLMRLARAAQKEKPHK